MPTKKVSGTLNASNMGISNYIRQNASPAYQYAVPYANPDGSNLGTIQNAIFSNPILANEFVNSMLNRIGLVDITSRAWKSPLGLLEQGVMELGETVEETFINIKNAIKYDPVAAQSTVFQRSVPDVRTAFHTINSRVYYKDTINRNLLRGAFLSYDGINKLCDGIFTSMYNSMYNDKYLAVKYLIARAILDGTIKGVGVPTLSDQQDYKDAMKAIRSTAIKMNILNPNYNQDGVWNFTPYEDMYIIVTADFEAAVGVEVLASAFHMSETDYIGHRIAIDDFSTLYNDRLSVIFAHDPTYVEITEPELEELAKVPCVAIDRKYLMIFTQILEFNDIYNNDGMEWHYDLHTWHIYSRSPYSQAALYVPGDQGVTSVQVNPATVTTTKGQMIQFTANVATTNFAPKGVTWSTNSSVSTITPYGLLTVSDEESAGSITVTATSVYDESKSGQATVTVSGV